MIAPGGIRIVPAPTRKVEHQAMRGAATWIGNGRRRTGRDSIRRDGAWNLSNRDGWHALRFPNTSGS